MRLIAFGCSNTFGQALPDVWDIEKNYDIYEQGPSKYAWPQVLADKLNLECVNLGIPGASNKEIWWKIINYNFQKNDIVFVLWTYFDRWCIIDINTQLSYRLDKAAEKNFFKYMHNHNDMILDFYLRANHIQTVLQDNVELIKHFRTDRSEFVVGPKSSLSTKDVNLHWNKIKFSFLYMDDYWRQNSIALDNTHPGPEVHEAFAMAIYNEIKDENQENIK